MKASAAYAALALPSAASATASASEICVPGDRITVGSHTFEYQCECAAKCNDANRSVCSYPPRLRRCVVGNENGDERSNSESTYMARVDDSHDDDPFAETCEDERDDCLRREAALKRELAQCKADLDDDSAPERPLCGYKTWDGNYYQKISGKTLAECEALCLAEDRCLSYSANSLTTGYIQNCYLYEKVTRDAPHTDYPSWVQYKACHKNEA